MRLHGKKILAVTMKDNEESYNELRILSNASKLSPKERARKELLTARGKAWMTERIEDTPPMKMPPGSRGIGGVAGLWWKLIDALEGRIKAPQPPKIGSFPYVNGRPRVMGLDWYVWWRNAR